jgi:hypothetical protein
MAWILFGTDHRQLESAAVFVLMQGWALPQRSGDIDFFMKGV